MNRDRLTLFHVLLPGETEVHITGLSGALEWIRRDKDSGNGSFLSHRETASLQCPQLRQKDNSLSINELGKYKGNQCMQSTFKSSRVS